MLVEKLKGIKNKVKDLRYDKDIFKKLNKMSKRAKNICLSVLPFTTYAGIQPEKIEWIMKDGSSYVINVSKEGFYYPVNLNNVKEVILQSHGKEHIFKVVPEISDPNNGLIYLQGNGDVVWRLFIDSSGNVTAVQDFWSVTALKHFLGVDSAQQNASKTTNNVTEVVNNTVQQNISEVKNNATEIINNTVSQIKSNISEGQNISSVKTEKVVNIINKTKETIVQNASSVKANATATITKYSPTELAVIGAVSSATIAIVEGTIRKISKRLKNHIKKYDLRDLLNIESLIFTIGSLFSPGYWASGLSTIGYLLSIGYESHPDKFVKYFGRVLRAINAYVAISNLISPDKCPISSISNILSLKLNKLTAGDAVGISSVLLAYILVELYLRKINKQ